MEGLHSDVHGEGERRRCIGCQILESVPIVRVDDGWGLYLFQILLYSGKVASQVAVFIALYHSKIRFISLIGSLQSI